MYWITKSNTKCVHLHRNLRMTHYEYLLRRVMDDPKRLDNGVLVWMGQWTPSRLKLKIIVLASFEQTRLSHWMTCRFDSLWLMHISNLPLLFSYDRWKPFQMRVSLARRNFRRNRRSSRSYNPRMDLNGRVLREGHTQCVEYCTGNSTRHSGNLKET